MNLKLLASDYFYDPSFTLKVIDRDPELPYPLHSHDFYELVVIISGSGTHFTKTNTFTLAPGTVFVIPPGLEHGYRNLKEVHLFNVLFDINMLEDTFADIRNMPGYHALLRIEPGYHNESGFSNPMQISPAQMAEVLPLLEQMQSECDSIEHDIGAKSLAISYFIHLLVLLFRIKAEHPRKDNQTIMRLAEALSFLEANPDRSVSTQELMELTNMSASTLNRHFQNATGLSPVEFHIQRRIEYACRLLRSSDYSMSQIAEATGFNDANYFSRQFKNVMGMSPREYRNNRTIWYR
ncbi:MAG: helix-turn-helix domain-containing protein [Sphaerochaetaceae bacterium]|nr:helix-turn-helix domain-containing protein [Sphaerochaetaceae bacterium]